jgi:hypothetical protein
MAFYDPPAKQGDFTDHPRRKELLLGWHDWIHGLVDGEIDNLVHPAGPEHGNPHPAFFDASADPGGTAYVEASVPWDAFPRSILRARTVGELPTDDAMYQASEALHDIALDLAGDPHISIGEFANGALVKPLKLLARPQDEYCEWFASRDAAGHVTKYAFTSEGPEYWRYLADGNSALDGVQVASPVAGDPRLVVALYQRLVDPAVREADLFFHHDVYLYDRTNPARRSRDPIFRANQYNPYNEWNTTKGIVHLTHGANTLGAEVNLAARATVLRRDANDQAIVDPSRLICCSGFGGAMRSSDPTIGAAVNGLVRAGKVVALRNPVGLYIDKLDLSVFEGPNGEDVSAWWKIVRGGTGMVLRGELAPPPGASFGLSQIKVQNKLLTWGGQIARHIQMKLVGIAKDGTVKQRGARCNQHCCVAEAELGTPDPLLRQVSAGEMCPAGSVDAFPELVTQTRPGRGRGAIPRGSLA